MGHSFSNHLYHVIFSTKNRLPLIRPEFQQRLYQYMVGIARHEFGYAIKLGGTENHLHGLIGVAADITVPAAMRKLKSLSSGWVHQTFPGQQGFAWQNGYGSFTVCESIVENVKRYIAGQAEHHRKKSFEDEFILFLKRNNIKFDPKTVWD